ncbi:putative L-serine dehydratase [Diplonema papillatum]|nr:putative L-serine dehydratase [Diplonema papillatum]
MPRENVSLFNDVMGPIMRGPSSSHTAAAVRIGQFVRGLCWGGDPPVGAEVVVEYDPAGSLATTAGPQGSNMGLAAGFLGFSCEDPRVCGSEALLEQAGVCFRTAVAAFPEHSHPNTYKVTVTERPGACARVVVALSLGGGALSIRSVDGAVLDFAGDRRAAVVAVPAGSPEHTAEQVAAVFRDQAWLAVRALPCASGASSHLVVAETPDNRGLPYLPLAECPDACARLIPCLLPVPRPAVVELPFTCVAELQAYSTSLAGRGCDLADLAAAYETARSGLPKKAVFEHALQLVRIFKAAVADGLRGTDYADRILGPQSVGYQKALQSGALYDLGLVNSVVAYTSAVMEVKSSFGLIVAAPTAGSCGVVPGCLVAAGEALGKEDGDLARAVLVAGLVGVFIATRSTFAAEEGGCQAECGAAGGMAAAALAYLKGGDTRQCLSAASMTVQSVLGMVCDPVANRVEAPCLLRNVCAASMAASSANMALAGYAALLPFDEVIAAHWQVSEAMPRSLKCTGIGGLAAQPTARRMEREMCGGCGCSAAPNW